MNGIEPLPPPSIRGACPLHYMDTFDMRLITPLVYFHEKLSEGSQIIDPPLGSDSHPQSVLCELPVREPLPT